MFIPALIFLASATFGIPVVPAASSVSAVASEEHLEAAPEKISLEAYVAEYFTDAPVLTDIARCESSMRHTEKDGSILRGAVDSDDIGVMQINTRYHQGRADELGIDIYSLDGNLEYAKYLYKKQGTKPWRSSELCWGKLAKK